MARTSTDYYCPDTIDYYDADKEKDVKILEEWLEMVKNPIEEIKKQLSVNYISQEHVYGGQMSAIVGYYARLQIKVDEDSGMTLLKQEAEKNLIMLKYLNKANKLKKNDVDLTEAESLVVTTYTCDIDDKDKPWEKPFNKVYNKDSSRRNFEPYRVYSTLLTSALVKLAKNKGIYLPKDKPLYRGVRASVNPMKEGMRIFWKAFTSTSRDLKVVEEFAGDNGTILVFRLQPSCVAAPVWDLSAFPYEQEVLLLPFQMYHYERKEERGSRPFMYFRFCTMDDECSFCKEKDKCNVH